MKLFKLISSTEESLTIEFPRFETVSIPIPKDNDGNILKGEKLVSFLNNFVSEETKESQQLKHIDITLDKKFEISEGVAIYRFGSGIPDPTITDLKRTEEFLNQLMENIENESINNNLK